MSHSIKHALLDAGCDEALATQFCELWSKGDTDGCLRLLSCHRCELVVALHEAQRPIDVCDWIIRELRCGSLVA